MAQLPIALLVGLLPVLLFLAGLLWLDSYKLVRMRLLLAVISIGGLIAVASYGIHVLLLRGGAVDLTLIARYVAPLIEETLKAAIVVILIRSQRIGFLVDGAILGFAVGAGFAVVENIYYLNVLPDARPVVWIVRGCGTAIMHGGTTTIFAMLAKSFTDRDSRFRFVSFLPGWALAVVLHSFFNHFFFQPVLSTLLILLGLPPLIVVVFRHGEQALEKWMGVGFDADASLLELIHSGRFTDSRVGRYLQSLTESFSGEVVADMICYLRLHVELSLRAKGELMMREQGFRTEIEPEIRENLQEFRVLERSIGKTGKLALLPFLHSGEKSGWQISLLER
jgi:RsiW-degrading membrane proteinase PrsW (M82 family)